MHCVILTRDAAVEALHTLMGMCLDYKPTLDGHDARNKVVGIITDAYFDGNRLMVGGYLFSRDFPEIEAALRSGTEMGDELRGCRCSRR